MASIGMDFGTTNSSLVAYDRQKKEFFYYASETEGKEPTPSIVWYYDNNVIVGKNARNNYNTYCSVPGHHIETSVKSKLGEKRKISIFGKLTEPYIVASEIIKHLLGVAMRRNAEKAGIILDSAVFTIPVNFTGTQRADLRKAAEAAGVAVETFIHEPFAALIGYLYSEDSKNSLVAANNSYILVFDWGGGTLDITVVRVEFEKLYEIGTSELTGIAGDRFDDELSALVRNRFKEKYSNVLDPEHMDKILEDSKDRINSNAEMCKIELSTQTESEFFVENIFYDEKERKPYNIDEKISRSDFEGCINRHVEAASNRIEYALRAADITHEQISYVLLTGGTSNIPLIRAAIEDKFGSRVHTPREPSVVIAQGAAVVAEMKWSPYLSKDIMVELSDGSYWTAFQKGLPLVREDMPSRREVFTCVDTRAVEAKLIVVEGSAPDKSDKNLAILNVPVLHNPSLRSPDDIDVDFVIDNNIVLSVKGYGKQAGKRASVEVHNICFGLELKE
jgi:molecular chaperone DnaK (HSP70)